VLAAQRDALGVTEKEAAEAMACWGFPAQLRGSRRAQHRASQSSPGSTMHANP